MRMSMTCLLALLAAGCSGSNGGSSSTSGGSSGGSTGASATLSGALAFPDGPVQSYVRFGSAADDGGHSRADDGGPDLRTVQWLVADPVDVSGCGAFGSAPSPSGYFEVSGVVQTVGAEPVAAGSYTVPASSGAYASLRYTHALDDGGLDDLFADAGTVTFTEVSSDAVVGTFDGFFALSDGGTTELQGSYRAPYCPR